MCITNPRKTKAKSLIGYKVVLVDGSGMKSPFVESPIKKVDDAREVARMVAESSKALYYMKELLERFSVHRRVSRAKSQTNCFRRNYPEAAFKIFRARLTKNLLIGKRSSAGRCIEFLEEIKH